jgi:hypothetical protein
MSKRTLIVIAGTLICGLLVSGVALAMSSNNYRLDWLTPLTGGGGGAASSTSYGVNLTVGQSSIGMASSTSYGACLGYWCAEWEYRVYVPLVMRDF